MVEDNNTEDPETDLNIRSMYNFQITAITIITTITFAAGLQLPGGFDTNGKAVPRDSEEFKEFLKCVSAAFVTSASAMFIHFLIMAFFSPKYHSIEYATVLLLSLLIEMSILFLVLAFGLLVFLSHRYLIPFQQPISNQCALCSSSFSNFFFLLLFIRLEICECDKNWCVGLYCQSFYISLYTKINDILDSM